MGQIENRGRSPDKGLTYDKSLAYMMHRVGGESQTAVAQKMGKSKSTISRYIADFDAYVRESPAYHKALEDLTNLIPDAVQVFADHVKRRGMTGNPDLQAARDILKVVGLMIERKQEIKENVPASDSDILDKINNLTETIGSG